MGVQFYGIQTKKMKKSPNLNPIESMRTLLCSCDSYPRTGPLQHLHWAFPTFSKVEASGSPQVGTEVRPLMHDQKPDNDGKGKVDHYNSVFEEVREDGEYQGI